MKPCFVAFVRPVRQPARQLARSTLRFAATTSKSARPAKPHLPRSRSIPKPKQVEQGSSRASKAPLAEAPAFNPTSVQAHRAKQLYDAGIRQVYEKRGSSRVIASYVIGASFIGYSINLLTLRHWDTDTLTGMGSWQKTFVAGTNKVTMFACSLIGGLIILRYSGLIRSIRLVETSPGTVKMNIHMRRRVPWSNTHYTVEPENVVMPRHWQQRIIPDAETESSRTLVAKLGKPYAWLKSWILMDGIVAPVRLSARAAGQLDTKGTFGISLNEFSAITSQSTR